MKKIIALSLVAGGLAFAQSGLQGGTSGIHQHNAYTLGQWGIEVGTGGDISWFEEGGCFFSLPSSKEALFEDGARYFNLSSSKGPSGEDGHCH